MKLLTHNFLSSKFLKGVKEGYPLILRATKTNVQELKFDEFECNEPFVKKMVPKLDYAAFRAAAQAINVGIDCDEEVAQDWETNEEFLKKLHFLLTEVEVLEGELECPETHKVFPIREGIPNMLAKPDEVDPV